MSFSRTIGRFLWFMLGLGFLIVNTYAVYLYARHTADTSVRVVAAPAAGDTLQGLDKIVWRFAAPMVPLDTVGTWTRNGPVTFVPERSGVFKWNNPRELVFRPADAWPECTTFVATLDPSMLSVDLRPVREPRSFSFDTPALTITGLSQVEYGRYPRLRLTFSSRVSNVAVAKALTLTDENGRAIEGRLPHTSEPCTVDVIVRSPTVHELNVTISKGLRGLTGHRGLEQEFRQRVALSRELRVEYVGADMEGLGPGTVVLMFNQPIDIASAPAAVSVDPPLPFTIKPTGGYGSDNTVRLVGDFAPAKSYVVKLKSGLRSRNDAVLAASSSWNVTFPDVEPAMELDHEGHYLSPGGNLTIPLRLCNVKGYQATVHRVYPNNLVPLEGRRTGRYDCYYGDDHAGLSRQLATRRVDVNGPFNQVVDGTLALAPLIGQQRGAFHVTLVGDSGLMENHFVVVSDTGLSVRRSDNTLLVWANSLRTLAPVADAELKLFSLENQLLCTGRTDADGLGTLDLSHPTAEGEPFLLTAQRGDDLTYLVLDTSMTDVGGATGERPYLTQGYEAFAFTDRGIYRPGETVHLKTIVRGPAGTVPTAFPLNLNVLRPDGKRDRTLTAMLSAFGTAEFTIEWPDFAATGDYTFTLQVPGSDEIIGQTEVAVEEFVPPQIAVTAKTEPSRVTGTAPFTFDLSARYLFGRDAQGLIADARVEYSALRFAHTNWPEYVFGDATEAFAPVALPLGQYLLDANGHCIYKTAAAPDWHPRAPLNALFIGTCREISGRAVSAYAARTVDLYPFYLGLKSDDRGAEAGHPFPIALAAVRPDGTAWTNATALQASVCHLTWTAILKKDSSGSFHYVSEEQAVPVDAPEAVALNNGQADYAFQPPASGTYRAVFTDPETGMSASCRFYAHNRGQSWNAWSMEVPDKIDLELDKQRYRAGETARLTLKAPFTGKALLTIESDRIQTTRVLELTNNTAELTIPVVTNYAPNVYCFVSLLRPVVGEATWSPHRAAGMIPLVLEQPERRLTIALSAPDAMRPAGPLEVECRVSTPEGTPAHAEVAVAAVDEGICMLTAFETPDPYAYFSAPRHPAFSLCDLYAQLMPEAEETVQGEPARPGGGIMAALRNRLNPINARRFKPVALWAASCVTDSNGIARVRFNVPEFTGRLRLMATAVATHAYGSADRPVAVKRPLIVQSSLPRFLAPSDAFIVPVTLMNESDAAGRTHLSLTVTPDGATNATPVVAPLELTLPPHGTTNLTLAARAPATPGVVHYHLAATMNDERYADTIELAVRPPSPRITIADSGSIKPGAKADTPIPADWIGGTGHGELWLSGLPSITLSGGLDYLMRYPHGCLEQTTSQAFPLLGLGDLARVITAGSVDAHAIELRVRAGIERILSMQLADGSFSLWPGGSTYGWGSIYATHFLVEAEKAGQPIPEDRLKSALDYIEKRIVDHEASADEEEEQDNTAYNRSYACLVLARAGRPQSGWMTRLMESDDSTPRGTLANLAAALLAADRRRDALTILQRAGKAPAPPATRETGGCLRSNVRDDAILLTAWLDADPLNPNVPLLATRLSGARTGGRWYTTQENAMALNALAAYLRLAANTPGTPSGTLAWNNGTIKRPYGDTLPLSVSLDDYTGGDVTIDNTGSAPLYYCWTSSGVPAVAPRQEADAGLSIRRELLDATGKRLDRNAPVTQGALLVVKLTVQADDSANNIVIEDLLPAGLEIENVRLKTSDSLPWVKDLQTLPVMHADARDDRLVLFAGYFVGGDTFTYCYAVRAVTRGTFVWPAVRGECMYDPGVHGMHGLGTLKVVATEEQ